MTSAYLEKPLRTEAEIANLRRRDRLKADVAELVAALTNACDDLDALAYAFFAASGEQKGDRGANIRTYRALIAKHGGGG